MRNDWGVSLLQVQARISSEVVLTCLVSSGTQVLMLFVLVKGTDGTVSTNTVAIKG